MANKTYVVRAGDSLSKIARDVLGDINRWREIALLNAIASPYTIYVGEVLTLPASITQNETRVFTDGTQITATLPAVDPGISPPASTSRWGSVIGWTLAFGAFALALIPPKKLSRARRSSRRRR